jgi:peptidoglycan/LPS O-acetylase OafA/YrhL
VSLSAKRVPGLDLLRAFAIVWVMFFHAWTLGLGTPWLAGTRFGWMGVDLFFALSGYLIGRQWLTALQRRTASFGDFYTRRALRILPAFLVVVGAYFLLPSWREQAAIQPLWQFLTFTENLLFDASTPKAFSHVWSLCVEEHFYLGFPVLAWAVARRPSARLTALACLGVLALGLVCRATAWFGFVESAEHEGAAFFERIYYPTFARLDGLLAGVLLAIVEVHRPAWWSSAMQHGRLLVLLGVVLLAASMFLFDGDRSAVSSIVGYPLLSISMAFFVAAAASPSAWVQRVPLPGVAHLAVISYRLYLSHKLAFTAVAAVGGAGFLALSSAAMVTGIALHFAIERPFLRLREREKPYGTQT